MYGNMNLKKKNVINVERFAMERNSMVCVFLPYIFRFQQYETHLGLHVKCRIFLSGFFLTGFNKIIQYQISLLLGDQLDAQFLLGNTFILILYMFRASTCSSSGGQLY